MIDCVLDYHMSPQGCGVSKFNFALAQRLGVPCLKFGKQPVAHPLVSVKASEMTDNNWPLEAGWYRTFDLFFHDVPRGLCLHDVTRRAVRVYAGNGAIAAAVREYRPDVVEAFCPATVSGNAERGPYRVLVFGMSSKLLLQHFEGLREQLEIEHQDYTIELSTAVHEGNPWDVALTESVEAMRGIFGDKLRVLGFLGDDALAKELREVDAVAAYFTPALRANNTSYWAAVEAGKKVHTNRDEHSPQEGDPPASWDRLVALIQGAA